MISSRHVPLAPRPRMVRPGFLERTTGFEPASSCRDAEHEALHACEELRPYLRRELGWPLSELGRIRLRLGDLDGAEAAFLDAHHAGWDPQPGLALVQLARGRMDAAVASIRDALEHPINVPSKELPPHSDLRRAPLLDAQVEIEIAAGDVDRARAAADELERIAARFGSKALEASALVAVGRVSLAAGEAADAARHLEVAVCRWQEVGAPFETARARDELGRAHRALGNEGRAAIEHSAARAILEGMGAGAHTTQSEDASTVDRSHCVFRRDGDYWTVVFDGQTTLVRDLKGMRHLARLLAAADREFHVLDLVAAERGSDASTRGATYPDLAIASDGAGEVLDTRAKEAYRRRLADIDEDIEDARAMNDLERAAQAEVERDLLVRELSAPLGSAVATVAQPRHPSGRERASLAPCGRRFRASQPRTEASADISIMQSAPAPTARTFPTRAPGSRGRSDIPAITGHRAR